MLSRPNKKSSKFPERIITVHIQQPFVRWGWIAGMDKQVMDYIMKKRNLTLLIFLLLTISLSAQIVYDTIPDNDDEVVFGGLGWDETFIFKDFDNQTLKYFEKCNFKQLDCYEETVFVSTTFGKNGELKNTRIIKSVSPICDSIAFHFVNGLKNWLPGLQRGRFVDIPFVFPITFDNSKIKDRYAKANSFFNVTVEDFDKRKEYFDFVYSNSSQKIINDFEFFYKYLAEKLSCDSGYVYWRESDRPKKRNRVKVEPRNENKNCINYIIYYPDNPRIINYIMAKEKGILYWDKYKWAITPNFTPAKKNGTLYLEKDKPTMLIGFIAGKEEPKLAIYKNIVFENDTVMDLHLKLYEKNEMLNDVKYSP
jgi:hypothetical protein